MVILIDFNSLGFFGIACRILILFDFWFIMIIFVSVLFESLVNCRLKFCINIFSLKLNNMYKITIISNIDVFVLF